MTAVSQQDTSRRAGWIRDVAVTFSDEMQGTYIGLLHEYVTDNKSRPRCALGDRGHHQQ